MAFVEKRKKKFRDRKDGHRVRRVSAINKLMAGVYPNRCDAEVSSTVILDITNLMNYIKTRKEKDPNCQIKFFHCFIAAIVRVINDKRLLLRFIQNSRLYERDEINIAFTAKRAFNEKADESIITYIAKKDDNVDSVTRYVLKEVNGVRDEKIVHEKEKSSKNMEAFKFVPDFVIRMICWFLRKFEKHGIVFKNVAKQDPSYSTLMLANLGSIGCKSVYHHLNNYGSCSGIITIGTICEKEVKMPDGHMENKSFVDITATFDERIADGFYFIKALKLLQQYLDHPEVLEKKFDEDVKF